MTIEHFEQLVTSAGLNVFSKYAPRFLVSLHVPMQFGTRIQTAAIAFSSMRAFEAATVEEAQEAINDTKSQLERAAQTKQGTMARGGVIKARTRLDEEEETQKTVNYPAH